MPVLERRGNGERGRFRPRLLAAGYVGVAAVYLVVPLDAPARVVFGHAVLLTGAAAAMVCCLRTACCAGTGSRLGWYLFAGAGAAGVVAHGWWAVEQVVLDRAVGFGSPVFYLMLLFHPFFGAGAAVALRPARARGTVDIVIDGALIVAGVLVLISRLVFEPVVAGAPAGSSALVVNVLAQLGAVSSCLFAGLLVLWGDPVFPGRTVPALAGTAAAFLAVTILTATGVDPSPRSPGDAFDLLWLAGWVLLAAAGLAGKRGAANAEFDAAADRIRRRLRRAVAPGAGLFLGAAAVDAALHPGTLREVAAACMGLSVLLAIRIRFAAADAERRVEEGVQLAHTRALVELSRALAGATELSHTLELVTQWACRLLDARAAGIELLTADGTALELRAAHGLPADVVGMRFPVEGSFTGWVVRQRRPRATVNPSADPYIRPESIAFLDAKPTAAAPLHFGDRPLGALFATNRDRPFTPRDLELLGSLADQAALAIENAQLFEQVHALSMTDPLTGLANRRQLERELAREFAAARRGRKLVLVLFDLDGFKAYNDRHGHLAGDEVLRIFGQVLSVETRTMNLAVRYGGDEFLALLTESDVDGARVFIERVQRRFRDAVAQLGGGDVAVSAGLAPYDPAMGSPEDLIAAADRVLYEVKAGRPSRTST
ncbi:MAG TPA: sensor domain-containing diguanylate cyclase [Longimicrobiales bacterium]